MARRVVFPLLFLKADEKCVDVKMSACSKVTSGPLIGSSRRILRKRVVVKWQGAVAQLLFPHQTRPVDLLTRVPSMSFLG